MAGKFHNPLDPGSISRWKDNVAAGVRRAMWKCSACGRAQHPLRLRVPVEGINVRQCRYCGHEVNRPPP